MVMTTRKRLQELAGLKADKTPLNEGRTMPACTAHASFKENCKSCQKWKTDMESIQSEGGTYPLGGCSPPHKHFMDESLIALFKYRPGGHNYDAPSYDNIVKEMYEGKDIPEYVVECMNEANDNVGAFLELTRGREGRNDLSKTEGVATYYPELDEVARKVADKTLEEIKAMAGASGSEVRYKDKYVLAEVMSLLDRMSTHFSSAKEPMPSKGLRMS